MFQVLNTQEATGEGRTQKKKLEFQVENKTLTCDDCWSDAQTTKQQEVQMN